MIINIVLLSIVIFAAAYRFYGKYIEHKLELDNTKVTPANKFNDGIDYVPAKTALLLGQHFSAIAAAGPIVGPILAGIWFGWIPAFLWIVFGSILIGGVHDFTSLVASVRHDGWSIGEIIKKYLSVKLQRLFLIFVWLALVYVIIAFTDITAQTFKIVTEGVNFGANVAVSSFLYLFIGITMGIVLRKTKIKLWIATAIFLPLVLAAIYAGSIIPINIQNMLSNITIRQWEILLLIYCFVASLLPVWLLLQPRGYLGGWFLYFTIIAGLIGSIFGGFKINYPAMNIVNLKSLLNGKPIFPILFITVACGACSGFHGIVSSGTTSKQLDKEKDATKIGYGAMLLEGLVAVLALATLIMLPQNSNLLKGDPNLIYANGIATYLSLISINYNFSLTFALIAFSTFIYDTLDVCTRLARYILQELLCLKNTLGAYISTFLTLILPFIFLMITKEKGYLVAWPIFGTSNQLLVALTLLAVFLWVSRGKKFALFIFFPMVFMTIITFWSLILQITPLFKNIGKISYIFKNKPDIVISGFFGIILLCLAIWLITESFISLLKNPKKQK